MTVSGSVPGAPSTQGCWIPCGREGAPECPAGYSCGMIHNGPGMVCSRAE